MIDRSVSACTVVPSVALSLPEVESVSLAATVAVLLSAAVCPGSTVTTKLTISLSLTVRAPMAQVTVPPASVQSDEELKVTPAGKTSVTVAPVESEGPLLVTVRV